MYSYRAFGLHISSEFILEHLTPSQCNSSDVSIGVADLEMERVTHGLHEVDRAFLSTGAGVVMHWRGVGTVRVRDGQQIEVDFAATVPSSVRTLALTGPPMGVLLEQRGNLVLHASAVVINGLAFGFMGHKGFGKSTTVAALGNAGHPLLTDDILAVSCAGQHWRADPGVPVVKLWPSSFKALFTDCVEGSDSEKRTVAPPNVHGSSAALGALFVLRAGEPSVDLISGRDSFLSVLRNTYASRFVGSDGTAPDLFRNCSELVQSVPVYALYRRPSLDDLPLVVSIVEGTAASVAKQRAGGN